MSFAMAAVIVVAEIGQEGLTVWTNCDYTSAPLVAVCDGFEREPGSVPVGGVLQRVSIDGRHGVRYDTTCSVLEQGSAVFLTCVGLLSNGFE
jgi:hypothetical protein